MNLDALHDWDFVEHEWLPKFQKPAEGFGGTLRIQLKRKVVRQLLLVEPLGPWRKSAVGFTCQGLRNLYICRVE